MENKFKPEVAIVILTFNRPDFVIRQLEYYAKVKCPHPIYVGDASNSENKEKIKAVVEKLSGNLSINYYAQPEGLSIAESNFNLYDKIKEKYCVWPGDDDYYIPDSLTKCVEFLESNPDYSCAGGHSVSFRLTNNGAYGELERLADYPHHQIESQTAAQRLLNLMANFYITAFSVQRTKQMPKCWASGSIKDPAFAYDLLSSAMCSILGKSKILDCLSFIKQAGSTTTKPINVFEWITSKEWGPSFNTFCDILAKEISIIDGISIDDARKTVEQSVWIYLNTWLPYDYKKIYGVGTIGSKKSKGLLRKLRLHLGQKLPWLKNIYKRTTAQPIYCQVTLPSSPYYKDFQPVFNSFTGKYHKR